MTMSPSETLNDLISHFGRASVYRRFGHMPIPTDQKVMDFCIKVQIGFSIYGDITENQLRSWAKRHHCVEQVQKIKREFFHVQT